MCKFCDIIKNNEFKFENNLAVGFEDSFPVSKGHFLVIPKRHVETYFELSDEENSAMKSLALEIKAFLDNKYHPDGYNVGYNCGEAAGQSVFHCHMHIIPRYVGDVERPRGGIRKILKKDVGY
jgi:diadenosine tetraphosphate (Ap4A) HIT family hydrolase